MFTSFRSRLMAAFLGLIFFGFGGLTIWAGIQMAQATYADYGTTIQASAVHLANDLVNPLEYNQLSVANQTMVAIADNLGGQAALFTKQGELISTTDGKRATFTPPGDYHYQINSDSIRTVYTSAPVNYEGTILGVVQLALPATIPATTVQQRTIGLATSFAIVTLIGLGVALWLAASMTRPLSHLRDTALAMAQGDLSQRVTPARKDEIGEVGSAFNSMAERVEAMVAEQRAFASNASHELRTPLTTIRLRTEALQDSLDDPELTAIYVDEIDSEAKRMGRLVDDLLLLSRLDAKRLMAGNEAIDAARLLQVLQREYGRQANEKQIELSVSTAPDMPMPVEANLSHLRVVFGNVIGNAIKYTQVGGKVSADLRLRHDKVQLTVTDNGSGIAADDLPNIGKRFYRVDKAHSRDIPGTGLGLSLVSSILELYNGHFQIESKGLGHGMTVTIVWPVGTVS